VIKNVKVSESPEWLKRRLVSVGIRPINNIVDITNYVMMETGQPLHAFDMYKLKAQSSKLKATTQNSKLIIGVRRAKKGEGIITLDGQNRQLDETMLVITDGQKPIAVAGVMGGANSEVSEQTKDIILEAAIFNPVSVRQTAKKLGVRTEASLRFERGIDWFLPEKTLMKAGEMVRELSGGEVLSEIFKKQVDDPRPIEIRVKLDYINQLLGHNFRAIEVKAILGRLGFIVSLSRCFINVRVPSWRNDVKIPADIAEEVGRIFDYNKLKSQPIKAVLHPPKLNLIYEFKSKVREALKSLGYNEVYSYSFYGEKEARCSEMDIVNHFEVLNPISPEQRYLRTSLSPLLLENSSMNLRFFDNVKIFEIGRVFYPPSLKAMKAMGDLATSPSITMEYLPIEEERLTGIVSLNKKSVQEIYRLVKGDIEVMFKELGVKEVRWEIEKFKVQSSKFKVKVKGQTIKKEIIDLGDVSILSEKDKEDYKIRLEVVVFDFSISNLLKTADNYSPYVPVPSFPEMKRDLSFIVPTTVRYQDLINNIQKYSSLIRDICLIDEFYLPTGERSLTLRITYRSEEKTLISKEVEEIEQKIILSLEKKLGVRIRS
jgi:phenylalanyl-tRNA synthetase beta chain